MTAHRRPLPGASFAAVCTAALALAGCGGAPPAQGPVASAPVVAAPAEVAKPAPARPAPMPTDEAGLRARLAASPGDAAALSLLSKILWDAHRFDEGVALLEAARVANPALPEELLWALALHHDALGHTDVADSIATSLEAHVSDWSRDGSAATFLRLRRDASPDAESVARKALEAEPSAANQNNLGIALLYAGKPEEARKLFLMPTLDEVRRLAMARLAQTPSLEEIVVLAREKLLALVYMRLSEAAGAT